VENFERNVSNLWQTSVPMGTNVNRTRDWRLRPETPVLKCGPNAVQFGLDRRWAVRLGDLNAKEIKWLQASSNKQTQLRRTAVNYGVGQSRTIDICATLARSGFLIPSTDLDPAVQELLDTGVSSAVAATVAHSGHVAGVKPAAGGVTDLPALSALRDDGQGQTTLNHRALAKIAITDTGRLGAQVTLLLAAAGVGGFQLPDARTVTNNDIGPFHNADVGKRRVPALRRRLIDLGLNPALIPASVTPDLTISIETGTQGATYFGVLQQMAIPHLAVAIGEAEVEVGPFVLPSRTACAHCLQLTRAAADHEWAHLLAEICALPARPIETTLAGVTAAYVAAQALTFIDGGTPSLVNALATIALPELMPTIVDVHPHPGCGCTSMPPTV
jgi:hypothetical protein